MNQLTADQGLHERLPGLMQPVEIRDPNGKVLGTFTPALSPQQQEAYKVAAAMFDPEELAQIEKSDHGWHTIEDIRRMFGELEKQR